MGRFRHGDLRTDVMRLMAEYAASPHEVRVDGLDRAVALIRDMPDDARQDLLGTLGELNPRLRAELEDRLFTFEHLIDLDYMEFVRLIDRVRTIERDLWPLALKSCSIGMRDKVFRNLPTIVHQEVEYRLETMGKRRISQVHAAQRRIVEIARTMTGEGVLNFGITEKLV